MKVMKNKQSLPIPFLILILAGVVSLFSIVADRGSRASTVGSDSMQMQTVEQERMTTFYFRILSWLSDLSPRAVHPAKANPQPAPGPKIMKAPQRSVRPGRIELCTFPDGEDLALNKRQAHTID
jgi:hypothetical protein